MLARPGQTIEQHTHECIVGASLNASKIGLARTAALIGAFHDFGKWSDAFYGYMEAIVSGKDRTRKGSIDHSTAGAQHLWRYFTDGRQAIEPFERYWVQIIALCCLSHHEGCLIDNLKTEGTNYFKARITKDVRQSYYEEAWKNIPAEEKARMQELLSDPALREEWRSFDALLRKGEKKLSSQEIKYRYGLLSRFLLSCLVDADHSSAGGEPIEAVPTPPWDKMLANLDRYLARLASRGMIDDLRAEISQRSFTAADRPQGKFLMTLPTGAGKTLASLRFALTHALKHQLDRLIYVIPYTSIIDQNAATIREALGNEFADLILVHHANVLVDPKNDLSEEELYQEEKRRYKAECTWKSPVILTTAVQFLQTLFSKGSSYVRRMNSLASSVIIFDEVQALPLKSTYLLTSALNFMEEVMGCSLVLCTATQPIWSQLEDENWHLRLNPDPHIIPDYQRYFELFYSNRRIAVNIIEESEKWKLQQFADFALKQAQSGRNTLMVVNTKTFARNLYEACGDVPDVQIYHLSTNMIPQDRSNIITNRIDKQSLKTAKRIKKPVLCFSTQLIEAGVDVDFDVVIRSAAGLDSLVQAGGRCNRDAQLDKGEIFVVFPSEKLENINNLEEINIGKTLLKTILPDVQGNTNLLMEENALNSFYQYYYSDNKNKLYYPLKTNSYTMMDLLSTNSTIKMEAQRIQADYSFMLLHQSFQEAAKNYQVLEGLSTPVIVGKEKGAEIIEYLRALAHPHSKEEWEAVRKLLKEAMEYTLSLNYTEKDINAMLASGIIALLPTDYPVYILSKHHYDEKTGFSWSKSEPYAKNPNGLTI